MSTDVQQLLDTAYYAWLTTVRTDGQPQPTPVWFIWTEDKSSLIVFSEPNKQKLKNIAQNEKVALSWSNDEGYPFVVVMGTAKVDALTADERARYLTKYAAGIKDLGLSNEQMEATYSVVIRITPDNTRGGV